VHKSDVKEHFRCDDDNSLLFPRQYCLSAICEREVDDRETLHSCVYFSLRQPSHPGSNDCAPGSAVEGDSPSLFAALKPLTFKL
jgi:hypothetical protein